MCYKLNGLIGIPRRLSMFELPKSKPLDQDKSNRP